MGNKISRICACNDAGNPHTGEANLAANKTLSNGAERKNGKMDFYDCEAMNYDVHLSKKIEETHARAKSNVFEFEKSREKADVKNSHNTIADNTTHYTDNQNKLSNAGDVFIYEGDTVNHKKHGRGILKNQNGEIVYVGHFKDDIFNGRGCLILNNHDEYEGEFLEGKRSGFGTLISADKKYRYDGQWENDLKQGKGYEVVTDLYVYDGEFNNGKKNGTGTYTFSNGSYYEGTFKDDKIDGKGKYFWNEKRMYEGEWSENNINGFGVLYDSGKIYIGNFEKDKRNGKGLYINKDNNILIGNFINNELEGYALIISNKGEDFCKFANGKKMQLPDELISQNYKDLEDYKELKKFYDENTETVKKYAFV